MQNLISRSKCFPLITLDLALHIVPQIRYLGFTHEGRRVSRLRWRTCPLASTKTFDTTINRRQAPFSGAVAGEQVIKIQSSIAFVNIFSFSLDFFCIS
jgi:hypothetical protein